MPLRAMAATFPVLASGQVEYRVEFAGVGFGILDDLADEVIAGDHMQAETGNGEHWSMVTKPGVRIPRILQRWNIEQLNIRNIARLLCAGHRNIPLAKRR